MLKFLSFFFRSPAVYSLALALCSTPLKGVGKNLSIDPSINTSTQQRVFLISFAQGEVHERNQNYLAFTAINKGIDTIISYRRHHIDSKFYQENKTTLDLPRGVGYWLWKPYFILETLKIMAPNDILIYADAGIIINSPVIPMLNMLSGPDTNMILFENWVENNVNWIKRETYDIMTMDYSFRKAKHLNAAALVIKNTPTAYKFIETWLHYCCIPRAIDDSRSKQPEFNGFIDHRHDQAILTLAYLKYPDPSIKVIKWEPAIFVHHHRRNEKDPLS